MKLSFTLEGGLGDFILKYLGSPGDRLFTLLKIAQIDLRMCVEQKAGHDLLKGNPFFKESSLFKGIENYQNYLSNDISLISNLKDYEKVKVPLWLSSEEEDAFFSIKRPYAVFHPRASHLSRCLSGVFNLPALAQVIADYSGVPLLVIGNDKFGYHSHNVIDMTGKFSTRLSCKIVENASFFVGTHSSMQCAASVYGVPAVCIGPSHLLFHAFSAPFSYNVYLKPLFKNGSVFMLFDEKLHFMRFFEQFILQATSLEPNQDPALFRRKLTLSDMVSAQSFALSDISSIENKDHNPIRCPGVFELR